MQDLNDKITGGNLTATEWNEVPSEIQNVIEDLGLVLSSGDLNQLGKAIVAYASAGTFYSETGVADAYVATIIGAKQGLHALSAVTDGAIIRFRPGNVNTGASTLNVNSLGVKDIVRENGDVLSVGDLDTTRDAVVRWDQTANDWRVLNSALLTPVLLGLERPQDVLMGQLFRSSASVIQLRPLSGDAVVVGIDNKILKTTGNLEWDMASDPEGAEGASVPLYLYVRDNAGVLDEQISATAPDLPGGTKPGYKNADATRRCVGSTYNDVGSNLVESIWLPGGEVLFKSHDADHEHSLALTQNLWSAVIPVNIPLCATAFRVLWHINTSTSRSAAIGASDAATDPTVTDSIIGTNASEILLEMSEDANAGHHQSQEGIIPVASITAPGFKFTTYNQALTKNELVIKGYHCLFAPK